MKTILTSIAAGSLLVALAIAQPRYAITDLDPHGTFSQATYINNSGVVTGLVTTPDGTQHAVLWVGGQVVDMAKNGGLGGPNSGALGAIASGQAVGWAESY